MHKMTKGKDVRMCESNVKNVWERMGYTESVSKEDEKNAIKAELDALGVEYHHMLGIDKLRDLLETSK